MLSVGLPAIIVTICLGLGLALAYVILSSRPKRIPLPGPPNGTFDKLFEEQREVAWLTVAQRWGKTFLQDGFVTTADPALAKMVFNSRAHSVGRAWPYRLVPRVFPDSDGILFLGDDAWRIRHSALTPLFTGSNVQRFARAMLRAAFSVAHRNAVACAVDPASPTGPVTSPTVPRRLGDGTAYDLLAATRCVSKRVLLEWGLGIAADSAEGAALGATLDSYARTVLEVLPGSPLTKALSAYVQSFSLRTELRRQLADVVERRLFTGNFTNASIAAAAGQQGGATASPPPASVAAAAEGQWAPADSVSAANDCPPNAITRLLAAGFSPAALSSEVNHIHGAHKAAAFTATCAMAELGLPGRERVRSALAAEFERCCGRPDTSSVRAAVAAAAASTPGSDRDATVAAAHAAMEAVLAGASITEDSAAAAGGAGGGAWRGPSREDLEAGRLPLLGRVWRETLRRHVVSLGVMRRLGGDSPTSVAPGVEVPPGTDILVLLHALHHDPAVWGADAGVWDPDRWLRIGPGERSGVSRGWDAAAPAAERRPGQSPIDSFFPFLDGLRRCAGMHLAELQFAVILYVFTAVFDVKLVLPPVEAAQSSHLHTLVRCAVHPIPDHEHSASQDAALGHYALFPQPRTADGWRQAEAGDVSSLHGSLDPTQPFCLRKRRNMFTAIDGRIPFTTTY